MPILFLESTLKTKTLSRHLRFQIRLSSIGPYIFKWLDEINRFILYSPPGLSRHVPRSLSKCDALFLADFHPDDANALTLWTLLQTDVFVTRALNNPLLHWNIAGAESVYRFDSLRLQISTRRRLECNRCVSIVDCRSRIGPLPLAGTTETKQRRITFRR